jgi:hypothetical protein
MPDESALGLCITPDFKAIYFSGRMGLRYLPIDNNMIIHSQIRKLV